jgi:SRSO17 transposase
MADCSKGKKARSSYNWSLGDANWYENEVAQRKADLLIDSLCSKENDKMLLIIDDTFNEKKGLRQRVGANFTTIVKKLYLR